MGLSFAIAAGLVRAGILTSESRGTHDYIFLSQIRDSPQPGGPDPRIYKPQEQGGSFIPPQCIAINNLLLKGFPLMYQYFVKIVFLFFLCHLHVNFT
jgi:hypothetical protein